MACVPVCMCVSVYVPILCACLSCVYVYSVCMSILCVCLSCVYVYSVCMSILCVHVYVRTLPPIPHTHTACPQQTRHGALLPVQRQRAAAAASLEQRGAAGQQSSSPLSPRTFRHVQDPDTSPLPAPLTSSPFPRSMFQDPCPLCGPSPRAGAMRPLYDLKRIN